MAKLFISAGIGGPGFRKNTIDRLEKGIYHVIIIHAFLAESIFQTAMRKSPAALFNSFIVCNFINNGRDIYLNNGEKLLSISEIPEAWYSFLIALGEIKFIKTNNMIMIHAGSKAFVRIFFCCFIFCFTKNSFSQSVPAIQDAGHIPLIPVINRNESRNFVYPTVLRSNGNLAIFTSRQFEIAEIISPNGVLVFQQNIKGRTGRLDVNFRSSTPPGIYYLRLRDKENMVIQKIAIVQ